MRAGCACRGALYGESLRSRGRGNPGHRVRAFYRFAYTGKLAQSTHSSLAKRKRTGTLQGPDQPHPVRPSQYLLKPRSPRQKQSRHRQMKTTQRPHARNTARASTYCIAVRPSESQPGPLARLCNCVPEGQSHAPQSDHTQGSAHWHCLIIVRVSASQSEDALEEECVVLVVQSHGVHEDHASHWHSVRKSITLVHASVLHGITCESVGTQRSAPGWEDCVSDHELFALV